jgi:hypothetical protein
MSVLLSPTAAAAHAAAAAACQAAAAAHATTKHSGPSAVLSAASASAVAVADAAAAAFAMDGVPPPTGERSHLPAASSQPSSQPPVAEQGLPTGMLRLHERVEVQLSAVEPLGQRRDGWVEAIVLAPPTTAPDGAIRVRVGSCDAFVPLGTVRAPPPAQHSASPERSPQRVMIGDLIEVVEGGVWRAARLVGYETPTAGSGVSAVVGASAAEGAAGAVVGARLLRVMFFDDSSLGAVASASSGLLAYS